MFKNVFEKALKYVKLKYILDKPRAYVLQADKTRAYVCRANFLHPQCCKSRILEDRSDNCIIIRINVGPKK